MDVAHTSPPATPPFSLDSPVTSPLGRISPTVTPFASSEVKAIVEAHDISMSNGDLHTLAQMVDQGLLERLRRCEQELKESKAQSSFSGVKADQATQTSHTRKHSSKKWQVASPPLPAITEATVEPVPSPKHAHATPSRLPQVVVA